jgi:hypothetical protein
MPGVASRVGTSEPCAGRFRGHRQSLFLHARPGAERTRLFSVPLRSSIFDRAEPPSPCRFVSSGGRPVRERSDGSGLSSKLTLSLIRLTKRALSGFLRHRPVRVGGLVLSRASLQGPSSGGPTAIPRAVVSLLKGSLLGDGALPLPRLRGLPSLCRMCGNARHGPFWTKATARRCSSGVFEPPPLSLGADGSIVTPPAAERARRIPARASIWSCGFSQWEARRKRHRAAHFVRGF